MVVEGGFDLVGGEGVCGDGDGRGGREARRGGGTGRDYRQELKVGDIK